MRILVICFAGLLALASAKLDFGDYSAEIIHRINSMDTTWKAGNNFIGESLDSVVSRLGVKIPIDEKKKLPLRWYENVTDIPASFDARQKWPQCTTIPLIRDQAACGSCWAVAAAEAMSDRECIINKIQVNISAEELNNCCKTCGDGCKGGYPPSAWSFWRTNGLVTGGLYNSSSGCQPYSIPSCDHHEPGHLKPCGQYVPTPPCNNSCRDGYNVSFDKDKHFDPQISRVAIKYGPEDGISVGKVFLRGDKTYTIRSDVKQIQKEIMTNGPVQAQFRVYTDFLTYRSGVYDHKSGTLQGTHAVKLLGWGVENGVDYWLGANSWNTDWGDKGYFKMRRGEDLVGIEHDINAGIPRKM